jgi:site-specific DNA-methyltransferase (adenine-specific)/modification methylase
MEMIEPAVDTDRYLLVCGDSRKILGDLSAFDAVITDPPRGVQFLHSGRGRPPTGRKAGRRHAAVIAGDHEPFDPAPWLVRPWLFWGATHFANKLPGYGSWLVWDKTEGGHGPRDSFVDAEFAWCSIPGLERNIFPYLWKGVACRKTGERNGQRFHPAQKPIALMRWCIRLLDLPPGSLILDPYMGAGSTVIAALLEGHRAIGVEIDPRHCETARRRMAVRQDQPRAIDEWEGRDPPPPLASPLTNRSASPPDRPIAPLRRRGGVGRLPGGRSGNERHRASWAADQAPPRAVDVSEGRIHRPHSPASP